MKKELRKILEQYKKGENIIQMLNNANNSGNSTESIKISYDMQAGTYISHYEKDPTRKDRYCEALARHIEKLGEFDSFVICGVGEAITLTSVMRQIKNRPNNIYGFDISWSRVKYAKQFCEKHNIAAFLFTGDIFQIPLKDNSIDVVLTNHSLEPNGGREKEALQELYRIARKYLVINEPSYEFGSEEVRKRILGYGYVKGLSKIAEELGYEIIEDRLFDYSMNSLNPTGTLVIKKKGNFPEMPNPLACPISKKAIVQNKDCYFSPESLVSYPIINGIPCLLEENAVITTHFESN